MPLSRLVSKTESRIIRQSWWRGSQQKCSQTDHRHSAFVVSAGRLVRVVTHSLPWPFVFMMKYAWRSGWGSTGKSKWTLLWKVRLTTSIDRLPINWKSGRMNDGAMRCNPWTWRTSVVVGPCHGSGGYPPTSHRGGPGSIPCQSMWELWSTKWHRDRFFPKFLPVNFIPAVLHYFEKDKK
jgi:hypothetical protein